MPQSQQQQSEEEFALWKSNPVTKRLMAFLALGLERSKNDFINGNLVMSDQWASGMQQAKVIGRCDLAQTIIDLDYQQLENLDEE